MRFGRRGLAVAAMAVTLAACSGGQTAVGPQESARGASAGTGVVEVHRSDSCECCKEHERYLTAAGFVVDSVVEEDMAAFKDAHGVPRAVRSCHTALVDGYVVEGHVPQEAIDELLRTRPAVDGIAVAGMPPGSPGMGGVATDPLEVVTFTGDEVSAFMTVPPAR